MSRLDELPPDQRAALSLLLSQRKSYAQVAGLLGISEHAVHDRAHAALAVLAPREARELGADERAQIGEYLLGQQRPAERLATRTLLGASADARAWGERIAGELSTLANGTVPEIPPAVVPGPPRVPAVSAARQAPASAEHAGSSLPVSRTGGAVLLALLLAGVIVAVVLLTGGSGSHARRTGTGASKKAAAGPQITQRLALRGPSSSSKAIALVEVLSEGSKRAFYVAAEHLAPSRGFNYVIWLYNSPESFEPLSRAPSVGSDGRLAGGSFLPSNAGEFHEMLITKETSGTPPRPGAVVLHGAFSL